MEKIISINLAGRVIAIEDGAYISLKAYFESLQRYFAGEEGSGEIIADIESRVAELLEERLRRGSAAITEADVQEVITGMGRVEDFAAEEERPAGGRTTTATGRKSGSKRYYRDENDKIAGGVCSGIAAYLNVDPALIRVLFVIFTVGGWGAPAFLYLVLWIFVPATTIEGFRGRRLFRNSDDKWLGGVASGIAAYFGKETWVFRLAFAAPLLLNIVSDGPFELFPFGSLFFGSITGTFILIYIVLWVVLPIARSQFEKMEMRGEKVDLSSIRHNVLNEMSGVQTRIKDWSGEVSQSASSFMNSRGKDFSREAASAAGNIASRGGRVIVTIIKAFFFFIGATIAFSLFMALIGYAFGGFADLANRFVLQTPGLRALGWATVLLILGVPLIALVTFIVRRVLKMRGGSRYMSMGFSMLIIAGLVCAGILASELVQKFRRREQISAEQNILQPQSGRMVVTVPGQRIEYSDSLPWLHINEHGWDVSGDTMRSADVAIITNRSPDSLFHVFITRFSRGANPADARQHAGAVNYTARNEFGSDSLLTLDNGYLITKAQGYRGQKVEVTIQVPVGKKIRFDESVAAKLTGASYMRHTSSESYGYGRGRGGWEIRDEYDVLDWEPEVDYIMSDKGLLVNVLHPEDTLAIESYTVRNSFGHDAYRYQHQRHQPHQQHQRHQIHQAHEGVDRTMDSLERAMEAIERQKELLESRREDSDDE